MPFSFHPYLQFNLILLNIHKSLEYCRNCVARSLVLSASTAFLLHEKRKKVSIVHAVTETNDYSSSVSLEYKLLLGNFLATLWVLVPLQMSGAGFSFRVPTFPLMCVIIALTFPMGVRAADHVTSPGPPCFRRNHSRHQAPLPRYCGEAMIVWIFVYLAPSL